MIILSPYILTMINNIVMMEYWA